MTSISSVAKEIEDKYLDIEQSFEEEIPQTAQDLLSIIEKSMEGITLEDPTALEQVRIKEVLELIDTVTKNIPLLEKSFNLENAEAIDDQVTPVEIESVKEVKEIQDKLSHIDLDITPIKKIYVEDDTDVEENTEKEKLASLKELDDYFKNKNNRFKQAVEEFFSKISTFIQKKFIKNEDHQSAFQIQEDLKNSIKKMTEIAKDEKPFPTAKDDQKAFEDILHKLAEFCWNKKETKNEKTRKILDEFSTLSENFIEKGEGIWKIPTPEIKFPEIYPTLFILEQP